MESSVSQQPPRAPPAQTPERKRPPRCRPARSAAVLPERTRCRSRGLLVVIVFCLLKPDTYATSGNFQTIFGSQAVLLILALGLIVPLTSGDFDLSIAAVLSLASMVSRSCRSATAGRSFPAIVVGAGRRAVRRARSTAALVVLLGIDSFIVTLGSAP